MHIQTSRDHDLNWTEHLFRHCVVHQIIQRTWTHRHTYHSLAYGDSKTGAHYSRIGFIYIYIQYLSCAMCTHPERIDVWFTQQASERQRPITNVIHTIERMRQSVDRCTIAGAVRAFVLLENPSFCLELVCTLQSKKYTNNQQTVMCTVCPCVGVCVCVRV